MGTFCYMCDDYEGEIESVEHILLESLGSPLRGKGILCRKHNNQFGDTVDKELFAQLGHFSDMLGANRRKKKKMLTGYTVDNEEFHTASGLKGGTVIIIKIGEQQHKISGTDEKDVRKRAKRLFKKHAKDEKWYLEACEKLDNADFKDLLPPEQKNWFKNYLTDDPKMQLYRLNPLMIQSFIKTCLNFYFLNNGDPVHVEELISKMRNPPEEIKPIPKYIRMVNSNGIERKMREDDASHVVYIKGSSENKYLIGFVEIFSFFRILVFMNMTYSGEDVEWSWGYDVFDKAPFEPEIKVKVSKSELLDMQFNEDESGILSENYERLITAFNRKRGKN